jgi:predicted nucleic acid-binding protein
MAKRVLDTNKLIRHWKRFKPSGDRTPSGAKAWAETLIELEQTNAIVTPVELEMLGGDVSDRDRELTRAYLKPFQVIDNGRIIAEDWEEARHLIERIPRDPRPRGLTDCLIRAIADRLNYEVLSDDKGMPDRSSRRRRKRA